MGIMGYILSKFKRKKSTLEALEAIEKEINRISLSRKQNLTAQHNTIRHILTYGVVFWLLALGLLYYFYTTAKKSDDYLLFLPLVVVVPCLIYLFRRLLSWWYHRKITRDETKLQKLKDEKATILDEVMDKETYKVATKILERFDPGRLQGGGGPARLLPGVPRPPPPGAVASPMRPPVGDPAGMELRKRTGGGGQQSQQQKQLNSSVSIPSSSGLNTSQNPVNLNQTLPARLSVSGPAPPASQLAAGGPGHQPLPPPLGRPGPVPLGRGGGPPLPRPILPRERGYMERLLEYVVGDGPSNRYALICRQCQSHNGMALREEFEYISYRCCYCHYWNPARKQRPVAPKLPNPATFRPSDPDSSEESSKSEENSRANSRRSSVAGPEATSTAEGANGDSRRDPVTNPGPRGQETKEEDRLEARRSLSSEEEEEEEEEGMVMVNREEEDKKEEAVAPEASSAAAAAAATDQESGHIELINKNGEQVDTSHNPMEVDE